MELTGKGSNPPHLSKRAKTSTSTLVPCMKLKTTNQRSEKTATTAPEATSQDKKLIVTTSPPKEGKCKVSWPTDHVTSTRIRPDTPKEDFHLFHYSKKELKELKMEARTAYLLKKNKENNTIPKAEINGALNSEELLSTTGSLPLQKRKGMDTQHEDRSPLKKRRIWDKEDNLEKPATEAELPPIPREEA